MALSETDLAQLRHPGTGLGKIKRTDGTFVDKGDRIVVETRDGKQVVVIMEGGQQLTAMPLDECERLETVDLGGGLEGVDLVVSESVDLGGQTKPTRGSSPPDRVS